MLRMLRNLPKGVAMCYGGPLVVAWLMVRNIEKARRDKAFFVLRESARWADVTGLVTDVTEHVTDPVMACP